ncbi:MAG: GNAT family N-acetyltransferase [Pseudomonadota bacterium]
MVRTFLRTGREILIRQVFPEDKHLFVEGLAGLSNQDRYLRFFQHMPSLSEKMLHQLTELDHVTQEAFGALDISTGVAKPVGVARYVARDGEPGNAEFALTVASSMQGEGLGALLLDVLADRAVENGFHTFSGLVLMENTRMIKLLNRFFGVKKKMVDHNLEFSIPLPLVESAALPVMDKKNRPGHSGAAHSLEN